MSSKTDNLSPKAKSTNKKYLNRIIQDFAIKISS